MSDISKRKRWRSRPLRIRVLGSHTWKASCKISSPCDSMFSSNPKDIHRDQRPFPFLSCVGLCIRVDLPSSMLKCMASLALLGTLSMTSSPSLISPLPSSQHVRSSYKRKHLALQIVKIRHNCNKVLNVHFFYRSVLCALDVVTLRSSWYLVILWTGLMRYEEIELARRCLCWISCIKNNNCSKHYLILNLF